VQQAVTELALLDTAGASLAAECLRTALAGGPSAYTAASLVVDKLWSLAETSSGWTGAFSTCSPSFAVLAQ